MNKIKKILVTGDEGFIGQALVPVLINAGCEVMGVDIVNELNIFEITDRDLIDIDCVIHLAALTDVQESFEKPAEYYRTNVLGTSHITALCVRNGVKLVYISSAAAEHPYSSPYAESKYLAEQIAIGAGQKHTVSVLRLFNVYDNKIVKKGSMFDHFLHDKTIKIINSGLQARTWINLDDVVNIIKYTVAFSESVYVDVGIQKRDVRTLADTFADLRGVKVVLGKSKNEVGISFCDPAGLFAFYTDEITTNIEADIRTLVEANK